MLVLIAEDDPDIRALAATCLEAMGHEIVEAGTGDEALKILNKSGPVDLLFTDIVMPGSLNGLELAGWAAKTYPEMKIVLTSGYLTDPAARRFPLLPKPYLPKNLTGMVGRIARPHAA